MVHSSKTQESIVFTFTGDSLTGRYYTVIHCFQGFQELHAYYTITQSDQEWLDCTVAIVFVVVVHVDDTYPQHSFGL